MALSTQDDAIAHSYYPSARARLIIRLEDYGQPGTPAPPELPPQLWSNKNRQKKQDNSQSLSVKRDNSGVLRLVGPGDDPNAQGTPQQQYSSSDDLTHVIDGIIPISADWSQNGLRTADTLGLEFEFFDMPIDPRVIRSCAVEFFLGTVTAEEFAAGIAGELRNPNVDTPIQIPYNVIPDNYIDSNGNPRTNLRFQGWVDEWSDPFLDGSSPVVRLECTDNTRILIDQQAPPKLGVGTDDPIDLAIANYLANFPQFRGLSVEFRPKERDKDPPALGDILTKQSFPPGVGPSVSKNGDLEASVWDYLTDVTISAGLTLRFDGTTVIIQKPRTLYGGRFPQRSDDPFVPRKVDGLDLDRRFMLYGSNIMDMEFSRNFTKFSPQNVEVRCYNPQRGKTLIARHPDINARNAKLFPGDVANQKFLVKVVQGVRDQETLRSIAQQIYEVTNRQELSVNVVTKNLASLGGGNTDPDLLDLKIGDTIEVQTVREDLDDHEYSTVTAVQKEISTAPEQFLLDKGFPVDFAKQYAEKANSIGLPTSFKVKECHIDWDRENGVVIDMDLINYVEIRADQDLGEQETNADNTVGQQEDEREVQDEPRRSTTGGVLGGT